MSTAVKTRNASEAFAEMSDAHASHGMRISEAATPWWFKTPYILMICAQVTLAPLNLLIRVAEAMMAIAIIGIGAIGYLWWSGYIPDAQIVEALTPIGTRILSMVESAAN